MQIDFGEILTPQGIMVEPLLMSHNPIFQHCAGGLSGVTKKHLTSTVWPVMSSHGFSSYIIHRLDGNRIFGG